MYMYVSKDHATVYHVIPTYIKPIMKGIAAMAVNLS